MGSANPLKIARFHLHHFHTLDSTQVEARKPGYHPGDVILADIQTMGYGRRGRAWQSPAGNLFCTMVEKWTGYEQLGWLGYAVGLGLYDAVCKKLPPGAVLRLKWPNDLLLDGAKMTGILLEVVEDNILIGIGMNIDTMPETDQLVTCLNTHLKEPVKALDIIKEFLPCYEAWVQTATTKGFAALREAWLARAAFVGQEITARLADGNALMGVFEDLNEQGALVLRDESGHHLVTAADIYLNKKIV